MSALLFPAGAVPAPVEDSVQARTVGALAARALACSDGRVTPLAEWRDAPYAEAAGELVWLGRKPRTHHPRMVTVDIALPLRAAVRIDISHASIWQPTPVTINAPAHWRSRLQSLCWRVGAFSPGGFATLLTGRAPPFPLDLAVPRVRALAREYARGNADGIASASRALLGLGTGLTPSGDDLVGGALFAARLLGRDVEAVCARVLADAPLRTHRLSCALLADLAGGHSYGVLHDLVDALAYDPSADGGAEPRQRPSDCGLAPTRASAVDRALADLGAIGHSSGWDMFTGLVIGAACAPGQLSEADCSQRAGAPHNLNDSQR